MDERLKMSQRLRLIGKGFRSMIGRYPRDMAGALRRQAVELAEHPFADRWRQAMHGDRDAHLVAWLGHGSVLLRVAGKNVLIDPVFSDRIGMTLAGRTFGPTRLQPAPAAVDALPKPDLVVITHAHFDHLDRPTLQAVAAQHGDVPLVTARRTARLIPRAFRDVEELHWDEQIDVGGVRLTAVRPRHWGARTGFDRYRGYNAYVLEAVGEAGRKKGEPRSRPSPVRILHAADTALTKRFAGLGPLDLAVFGIGAYDPWHDAHATPEQVWEMATGAGARRLLPIHHSTFKLSDEPLDEPLKRLLTAAALAGAAAEPVVLPTGIGEVIQLD